MLAFLHGFLGSANDWKEIIQLIQRPALALNLPGHGDTPFTPDIERFLLEKLPNPVHLVGYSMGGRLALAFRAKHPKRVASLFLLSTHFGLKTEEERKKRQAVDELWAQKLDQLPIDQFLKEWYDQPLFKTLRSKVDICKLRMKQNKEALAKALLAFSLSKQPDLSAQIYRDVYSLIGEKDPFYRKLYAPYPHHLVANAGHAMHLENPQAIATFIKDNLCQLSFPPLLGPS